MNSALLQQLFAAPAGQPSRARPSASVTEGKTAFRDALAVTEHGGRPRRDNDVPESRAPLTKLAGQLAGTMEKPRAVERGDAPEADAADGETPRAETTESPAPDASAISVGLGRFDAPLPVAARSEPAGDGAAGGDVASGPEAAASTEISAAGIETPAGSHRAAETRTAATPRAAHDDSRLDRMAGGGATAMRPAAKPDPVLRSPDTHTIDAARPTLADAAGAVRSRPPSDLSEPARADAAGQAQSASSREARPAPSEVPPGRADASHEIPADDEAPAAPRSVGEAARVYASRHGDASAPAPAAPAGQVSGPIQSPVTIVLPPTRDAATRPGVGVAPAVSRALIAQPSPTDPLPADEASADDALLPAAGDRAETAFLGLKAEAVDPDTASPRDRRESAARAVLDVPADDAGASLRSPAETDEPALPRVDPASARMADGAFATVRPGVTAASVLGPLSADSLVRSAIAGAEIGAAPGAAANGAERVLQIQLKPVELGAVTATLRMAEDRLSVELATENAEAYRQLSGDSDAIVSALRGLGLQVDQVTVQPPQPASTASGRSEGGVPMQSSAGRDESFAQAGNSSGGNSGAREGNHANEGNRNGAGIRHAASAVQDTRTGRGLVI